jgi:hypothetical protein
MAIRVRMKSTPSGGDQMESVRGSGVGQITVKAGERRAAWFGGPGSPRGSQLHRILGPHALVATNRADKTVGSATTANRGGLSASP